MAVFGEQKGKSRPYWIFLACDWWRGMDDVIPEVKKIENGVNCRVKKSP